MQRNLIENDIDTIYRHFKECMDDENKSGPERPKIIDPQSQHVFEKLTTLYSALKGPPPAENAQQIFLGALLYEQRRAILLKNTILQKKFAALLNEAVPS